MLLHSFAFQIVSQTGKHFPQSIFTVQSPFLDLTNTHNYVRETFSRMSEAQVSYTQLLDMAFSVFNNRGLDKEDNDHSEHLFRQKEDSETG